MTTDDVDFVIELPGVYDGSSITVLKDGTWVNRWAVPGRPDLPIIRLEHRYQATQAYIEQWGARNG